MTICWIGCGGRRREHGTCSLCAPVLSSAARLVCLKEDEQPRIGARFICCRTSVPFPSMNEWSADGKLVCAGGVTAGIDGALRVAAALRGDEAAQIIQLQMQYAPEPPFNSGTPKTAPAAVLEQAQLAVEAISEERQRTAERAARRLVRDCLDLDRHPVARDNAVVGGVSRWANLP